MKGSPRYRFMLQKHFPKASFAIAICLRGVFYSARRLYIVQYWKVVYCTIPEGCTVAQYYKVVHYTVLEGFIFWPIRAARWLCSALWDMGYRIGRVGTSPLVLISVNMAYLVTEKLYLS